MNIENSLTSITNIMFRNRKLWDQVPDEYKESNFFIINRYLSKKYPELSSLCNLKSSDRISSMNIWFHYMKSKPYPNWMWSKQVKDIVSKELSPILYKKLLIHLNVDERDLNYLIKRFPDFIKEELKLIKDLEKQNK